MESIKVRTIIFHVSKEDFRTMLQQQCRKMKSGIYVKQIPDLYDAEVARSLK